MGLGFRVDKPEYSNARYSATPNSHVPASSLELHLIAQQKRDSKLKILKHRSLFADI